MRRKKIIKNKRLKIVSAVLAGSFFFGSGVFLVWALTMDIPDLSHFGERKIVQSTKIYDSTGGVLLYDVHGSIKRTVIAFDEIPRDLKNATVAIEDSNFYNHSGVSFEAIGRALIVNIISGDKKQGGSTITQQLVKNVLLTKEKTYTRKLKEAVLSYRVERVYSKEEVLNFYLNEIPYGALSYGVEEASMTYFGKPARDLTLAESAYLASIPKATIYYSPYGSHVDELHARKDLVLRRMNELGFISKEEAEEAMAEEVKFISHADESFKAPHFVMYVLEELFQRYGEDAVESEGFKVTTSLNWELQQKAEELTKKYVDEEQDQFNVYNAGMVGIDPKTGGILVMVGSRDWNLEPLPKGCTVGVNCKFEPQVNVTSYMKGRQPGSSIKPIIYASAFKKGYTPETVVFDLATEFNTTCSPIVSANTGPDCYHPGNYDNIFRGPITFREALAQSVNIPAVKVLYLAGLNQSLETARSIGITTLNDPARYGLTLVLGGGEVKLLELTGAYSVFANNGVRNTPTSILKIEDSDGVVLEEYKPESRKVLDENIARSITSILSDNEARAPAFGERSYLYFLDRQVAVKTGTTNDYRDAWVIGYMPNFALGVWFGNNDNSEMEKKVAGFIAAPLWNAYMQEVFKILPIENFDQPTPLAVSKPVLKGEWRGSRIYYIDSYSGKLATENTPEEFRKEKVLTEPHSILYWLDKNDPNGEIPSNPANDPQFNLWETPVRAWAARQLIKDQTMDDIPKEYDNVHLPEYKPQLSFSVPPPDRLTADGSLNFTINATGKYPIKQIDIFFNGQFLGTLREAPYRFTADASSLEDVKDTSRLLVKAYDTIGNFATLEKEINFCINGSCNY